MSANMNPIIIRMSLIDDDQSYVSGWMSLSHAGSLGENKSQMKTVQKRNAPSSRKSLSTVRVCVIGAGAGAWKEENEKQWTMVSTR